MARRSGNWLREPSIEFAKWGRQAGPKSRFRNRSDQFGFGRREIACGHGVLKTGAAVASIAERLILRLPATAEGDQRPARQPEFAAFGIANGKLAFYPYGAVVNDRNLRHSPDGN